RGTAVFDAIGAWQLNIVAWRDLFATWHVEAGKKLAAGQDLSVEIIEGRELVGSAAEGFDRAPDDLSDLVERIASSSSAEETLDLLLAGTTLDTMSRSGPRSNLTVYPRILDVWVDRARAGF